MRKVIFSLIIMLYLCSIAFSFTADEVVEKAEKASYYAGKDGRADVKMIIISPSGRKRIREFTILRLNTKGKDQKFYVYFRAPSDVRKMAYLVWKHVGKEDDRWLWLPALNLVKRIAPGDKRTSFVGSDFYYEDVSGRDIKDDIHKIIKETDRWYVIKNIPKDPDSVEFSYYIVWIDKKTFLPMKAEYYDRQGRLYRRITAEKIDIIQKYPTVVKAVAEDIIRGSKTINIFSNIRYNVGLKERIFSERFLRRPPREVR